MPNVESPTESRALTLLGQGQPPSVVASALGISESRISQMMADSEFSAEVQARRYENLQQSTQIDDKYNELETKLQTKLERVLPLINKPRDVLAAINVINGAKRRGQQAPDSASVASKVVNLTLPTSIQQQFITNNYQQITEIRDATGKAQTLVTATSGSLDRLVTEQASKKLQQPGNAALAPPGSGARSSSQGEVTVEDL